MWRLLGKKWMRDLALGAGLLAMTVALVLYPKEAVASAREGLELCGNVIVPSLFPFFVLSSLVVELGLSGYLGRALEGIMRPLFAVSGACASAFALGFVGGYPVGAKTAIELYEKGMCTKTEAERLLSFCNNSGPAFILGVVGAGVFSSSRVGVLLCLAHAAASVCVGVLFRFYGRSSEKRERRRGPSFEARRFSAAFTNSIKSSALSTLNICAFVVFFTVVIRLLFLTGFLPALAQALGAVFAPLGFSSAQGEQLLTGFLEVSSGVWSLKGEGALAGRVSMAAFMLGWAGVSVHCQVLSFISGSGLSVRTYLLGKLLHGGLSALLVTALFWLLPFRLPVSAYLAQQVEGIAGMDFQSAVTVSVVAAWVMFLLFFLTAALEVRKKSGKGRRGVVQ